MDAEHVPAFFRRMAPRTPDTPDRFIGKVNRDAMLFPLLVTYESDIRPSRTRPQLAQYGRLLCLVELQVAAVERVHSFLLKAARIRPLGRWPAPISGARVRAPSCNPSPDRCPRRDTEVSARESRRNTRQPYCRRRRRLRMSCPIASSEVGPALVMCPPTLTRTMKSGRVRASGASISVPQLVQWTSKCIA
jgi:hypothetical protein